MTGKPPPPPRLHVIPASGCDKALVLRRGPTMQVASCLWDRRTGEVQLGQWLKARIFEHRTDLSPDGQHIILFARRGTQTWTAISRAPWLTALACWPKDDSWFGGGAFDAQGRVFFNGMDVQEKLPDNLIQAPTDAFPHGTDGFHMGGLYPAMLVQRGWRITGGERYDTRLSLPLWSGWSLEVRFEHGKRSAEAILDSVYALVRNGEVLRMDDWEWCAPFGKSLHFAAKGSLWAVRLGKSGLEEAELVHDFSDMSFENRPAPYEGVQV